MSTSAGAQSYAECWTREMCRPPTTGSPGAQSGVECARAVAAGRMGARKGS
jgi:hypothetical protein